MTKIPILMPLADGQCISDEVIAGLAMQTAGYRLFVVTRPMNAEDKRISEIEARNELLNRCNDDVIIWMDSDVVLASPTDIEDAVFYMDRHPSVAAAGYNTKDIPRDSHIPMAFLACRTNVIKGIGLKYIMGECCCTGINKALKGRIKYIDRRKLKEVRREKLV